MATNKKKKNPIKKNCMTHHRI